MTQVSIRIIRLYQRVAPTRLRQACRFEPSCSEYAIAALEKHGFLTGWRMTASRLKRCCPPNGGLDVP